MKTAHALMSQLGKTILIGSGAIGSALRHQGEISGEPVELLNLHDPETIRSLHEGYRSAGSQILITNTFGANRLALGDTWPADEVREINEAGVRLARQVAGADCMVCASVGPLSLGARQADFAGNELERIYSEQCKALTKADAIILETFVDLHEAEAALSAAAQTGLPVIFQIGNIGNGPKRLEQIAALADAAIAAGAKAIGANCLHPDDIVEVVARLAGRTNLPLTASPNAGNPKITRGLVRYDFPPEALKPVAEKLAALGCAVIGGCCGTTPEHISQFAETLRNRPVVPRKKSRA